VQRILKEHGIGSVQRLADGSAIASFGAIEEVVGQSILEQNDDAAPSIDLDDDDFDGAEPSGASRRAEFSKGRSSAAFEDDLIPGVADMPPPFDIERLKTALQDLIACRQLLDSALREG
jgi:hypothetical protein